MSLFIKLRMRLYFHVLGEVVTLQYNYELCIAFHVSLFTARRFVGNGHPYDARFEGGVEIMRRKARSRSKGKTSHELRSGVARSVFHYSK